MHDRLPHPKFLNFLLLVDDDYMQARPFPEAFLVPVPEREEDRKALLATGSSLVKMPDGRVFAVAPELAAQHVGLTAEELQECGAALMEMRRTRKGRRELQRLVRKAVPYWKFLEREERS